MWCLGLFYAANASSEYVNFVNEDREFTCTGREIEWFLPNGSIIAQNGKYQIEAVGDEESKLTITKISPFDVGEYQCISSTSTTRFILNTYCKLFGTIFLTVMKANASISFRSFDPSRLELPSNCEWRLRRYPEMSVREFSSSRSRMVFWWPSIGWEKCSEINE